ncbi:MAG: hypothetical protein ACO22N_09515, partial [Ilumatobacteraceae bacterium]
MPTTVFKPTRLDPDPYTTLTSTNPVITAVGSDGKYVVTWNQQKDQSSVIRVDLYNADGSLNATKELQAGSLSIYYSLIAPVITALSSGGYVVSWSGYDGNDNTIYVQKFNADGTTSTGRQTITETGSTSDEEAPRVAEVGAVGEFVVVYQGEDWVSNGPRDYSIYVQRFTAAGAKQGSAIKLEGDNQAASGTTADDDDVTPQVTALGTTGEFVVTWAGEASDGIHDIYVTKFNADGSQQPRVKLSSDAAAGLNDAQPQVAAVGTAGEFVVTWSGQDGGTPSDYSIYVQKFDASGAITGAQIKLEPEGNTTDQEVTPRISALGNDGSFAVVWQNNNSKLSVYIQQFTAAGTTSSVDNRPVPSTGSIDVKSSEAGNAYLVKDSVVVNTLADITTAADDQWNSVAITAANT